MDRVCAPLVNGRKFVTRVSASGNNGIVYLINSRPNAITIAKYAPAKYFVARGKLDRRKIERRSIGTRLFTGFLEFNFPSPRWCAARHSCKTFY